MKLSHKTLKDNRDSEDADSKRASAPNVYWRWTKTVLKFLITGAALFWVSRQVDPVAVRQALGESNGLLLALAFIANVCGQIIASSRLNGHFRAIGLHLGERYNFRLFLLGLFYNLFLPGGIGGDGYKLYFLRQKFGIGGRKVFSAIFFDRLSGLWALALMTGALIVFIPQLGIPNWIPIVVLLLGTFVYYVVLTKYFRDFVPNFLMHHAKAVGSWSFQILTVILLLYALGFEGKFSPYLFNFLLSSLAAVFPFTIGGLGIREMVNVEGAVFFNLDQHLALLISLLFYIISALLALLGAYFIFNPKKLGVDHLPKVNSDTDT